jgi:hypothetical protein
MNSAYIYTNTEIMDVASEADILFTANGFITPSIKHNEGDDKIIFNCKGIFVVDFFVNVAQICTSDPAIFAITINGRLVSNSLVRTSPGNSELISQTALQIEDGDVLRIKNCSGHPIYFNCFTGGQEKNIRASITINQIE